MEGENERNGHSSPSKRVPLKTLNSHKLDKRALNLNWKKKLRESCCKRVQEERARLLWNCRLNQSRNGKELVKSALEAIVTDELKKIERSLDDHDIRNSTAVSIDELWEDVGPVNVFEGDREEILLEMQRIFYEDLKAEEAGRGRVNTPFAQNDPASKEQTWCPICRKGELLESQRLIYCSLCPFNLNKGNEVNLGLLRARLAEAHEEHLNRGCRSKPDFSVETIFDLTALYICCQHCHIFEVVL